MALRTLALSALFVLISFLNSAAEQQPLASSTAQKNAATTKSAASPPSRTAAVFAAQSANSGQELAHVSNEAAGEDETAAFKYSPAVRGIAKITGLSLTTAYWVCVVINFAIIAVGVLLFLKSSLPAAFRARTQNIQKEMDEARNASQDAQRRLKEIEERLSRMNVEIGEMQARAESDAKKEEQRIRASIEEEKQKILQAAEQELEQAANAARRDLQKYAVALAVEMAEKGIHVDANADKLLVDDFVGQLSSEVRRNGGS
jgi:F-type H+-transporting ATPase subunit b